MPRKLKLSFLNLTVTCGMWVFKNNNSKIIKITDDEVVFTFNLDNDMKKKRLTVKSENKDIHFKLEDIN